MKKRIILPTILLTGALAVGSLGFAKAYAQDSSNYAPIVQKIAERFGLNATEVQEVFEEIHSERQAERETRFSQKLTDLVENGKITQEQKEKILDKHEEMQAKMDEWKDLSFEERREKMKAFHQEMKTWAKENGIGRKHGLKGGMFLEKLN